MTLAPGARLGPYEIVTSIGAGGMGEVYRALDTRLHRTVAVKVLAAATASPEASARFEREARTISRFSHPHICQLHDVGTDGGTAFLVMELVDGETLAARLARGLLALEDVRRFGIQMADALDAAHRAGIVHRDLKPGNVMLPRSGVKLLDFGLAKTRPLSVAATVVPTVAPITERGSIAGTVAYMAPEVLEGRDADERSDIYALGAVLYEMATGQRYFHDPAAQVRPRSLERIVRGCLARDADDRWQSARDIALQLAALDADVEDRVQPRAPTWWVPWSIAALAVIAAAAGWLRAPSPLAGPGRAIGVTFSAAPPSGGAFFDNFESIPVAMAPDGSQIAYIASDASRVSRIYLRPMDAFDGQPLPGTDGASALFWSPDGRSLAFVSAGKLRRIDVPGGTPIVICDVSPGIGYGGTWGAGDILFATVQGSAIYRVAASGGTPTEEISPDRSRGEQRTSYPSFLPDGQRYVYSTRTKDGAHVMLAERGKASRVLADAASNAQYIGGYLLYVREGTLVAQRVDAARVQLSGPPIAIASPVRYFYSTGAASFSAASNGALVYQSHADFDRLAWLDRTGASTGVVGEPGRFNAVRISPDGRRAAFSRAEPQIGTFDLWLADMERGGEQRLTSDRTSEVSPVWHPSGGRVFFTADRGGPPHLFVKELATGEERMVLPPSGMQSPESVSPDGAVLAFSERGAAGQELWTIGLGAEPRRTRLLPSTFSQVQPEFAPDGLSFAFVSAESGRSEVYLSAYPPNGSKVPVSTSGGTQPRWRRDGQELFFLGPERQLMSVSVRTTSTAVLGTPATLFTTPGRRLWKDYDVSPDGKRFLAIVTERLGDEQSLSVVTNWLPRDGR